MTVQLGLQMLSLELDFQDTLTIIGLTQNDEMQGKNLRKTGMYPIVHEDFE